MADALSSCNLVAEGDDGEYHSPKSVSESVASGYFSATESNASGMPLRGARSGGPPPMLLPTTMQAAGQVGRTDESGASSNDEARDARLSWPSSFPVCDSLPTMHHAPAVWVVTVSLCPRCIMHRQCGW